MPHLHKKLYASESRKPITKFFSNRYYEHFCGSYKYKKVSPKYNHLINAAIFAINAAIYCYRPSKKSLY
jgi:hypothetical protein